MQLKSLEIQGFKSFPDKTKLTFIDGITAVVGPNGSGKSNIADAVRWVLGEQSSKTLRGNKMEDVIFDGTQTRKQQGFAQVTLTIDNAKRLLPIEADEVGITRKLYRSGESEYRINNTAVRLKDVYELFMDTGLGRDGYSIIGQGRIAEIVSAKGKERREIFEEAAGIAKYRYRKSEAEKRLSMAEENLLRLKDIVLELEGRIEPLKRDSEKASQFLKLSDEKRVLEISVWMTTIEKSKVLLREQEDKILICKSSHDDIENEINTIEETIEALYLEMNGCASQIDEKRNEIKSLEEMNAKFEADIAVSENNIFHNERSIEQIEQDLLKASESFGGIDIELSDKTLELEKLTALSLEKEVLILDIKKQLTEKNTDESGFISRIEGLKENRAALYSAINETKMSSATSMSLIEETLKRLETIGSDFAVREENIASLKRELDDCRELISTIDSKNDELENSKKGYTLKLDGRKQKQADLLKRKQEIEDKIREKEQRARLLSDMEKNMEGFGQSVKYILKQAQGGAIQGIHGAVSKIVSTESKYSVAIETALGAAMQNIVVSDENVAKQAIRSLMEAKAGRATFLPLTSIKGNKLSENGLENADGFIGVASDIVSYDIKYNNIILSLLGRIAIVDDIDNAVIIAKKYGYKFRIVTLDGQVVNAGGSFTGGYTARSAGILNRQSEIDALLAEADKIRLTLEENNTQLKAINEEVSSINAYIEGVDAEIKTANEDKIRYSSEIKRIEFTHADAVKQKEMGDNEKITLKNKLAELKDKNLTSDEMLSDLQKQLDEIEEKITNANAERDNAQSSTSNLKDKLSEESLGILGLQKDLEAIKLSIDGLKQSKDNQYEYTRELSDKKEALINQNTQISLSIEGLKSSKGSYTENIAAMQEAISKLNERRNECEKNSSQLRAREKEVITQREGISKELVRLEERKSTLQTEFDSIIQKLWDEYEMTRTDAELIAVKLEDLTQSQRRLNELRNKIKALGNVNLGSIEEYKEVSERYVFMKTQIEDIDKSKLELNRLINELTDQMKELFTKNFNLINQHFSKIFVDLFGGGKAHLILTDSDDILESGIEIFVQPPGKLIKNLSSLSGGEQSFVAIAIYFAILRVNPAPFCLLDEIEAALDDVNVSKYASYLRRMSDKTQFIAITHRRGTMEEADVLYGVTMQEEGISKLLELKVTEVESKLGIK